MTAPVIPGDFHNDGDVDGRDFLAWQRGQSPDPHSSEDLASWQNAYSASLAASTSVPEPTGIVLLAAAAIASLSLTRR